MSECHRAHITNSPARRQTRRWPRVLCKNVRDLGEDGYARIPSAIRWPDSPVERTGPHKHAAYPHELSPAPPPHEHTHTIALTYAHGKKRKRERERAREGGRERERAMDRNTFREHVSLTTRVTQYMKYAPTPRHMLARAKLALHRTHMYSQAICLCAKTSSHHVKPIHIPRCLLNHVLLARSFTMAWTCRLAIVVLT